MKRRGKNLTKLVHVMNLLAEEKPLDVKHDDHPLKGNFIGYRECKIEPDWLLVYTRTETHIALARTGTHSDIFK